MTSANALTTAALAASFEAAAAGVCESAFSACAQLQLGQADQLQTIQQSAQTVILKHRSQFARGCLAIQIQSSTTTVRESAASELSSEREVDESSLEHDPIEKRKKLETKLELGKLKIP